MKCTAIVNGSPCGGDVVDGTCEECFADYSSAPLVAPSGEPNDPTAVSGSDPARPSGNSTVKSGTRSQNGSSRLGSGRSAAAALGLVAQRKPRNFSKSNSRTRSQMAGIGRNYIQVPEVEQSDPRSLIKQKYLKGAVAARTCTGDDKELGCATNSRDKPEKKWAPRPHADFPILRKTEEGLYVDKGICPKCSKPFDFTALEPMPLMEGELVAAQYDVLGVRAKGGCGYIYVAKDRDLSAKPDPANPTKQPAEQYAVIKAQITRSERDDAVSAAEKQMLANLRHPTIVSIYRFTEHKGQPMLITEWLDGVTVEQIWDKAKAVLNIARAAKANGGKLTEAQIANAVQGDISSSEAAALVNVPITLDLLKDVTKVTLTQEQVDDPKMGAILAPQAVAYVLAMCESMIFLHEQRVPVLNPDIKPGNFMVRKKGTTTTMTQFDAGGWILATDMTANITSTIGFAPKEVDAWVDNYDQHVTALELAREAKKTGGKLTLAQVTHTAGTSLRPDQMAALTLGTMTTAKIAEIAEVELTDKQVSDPNFKFIGCDVSVYSDQYSLARVAAVLANGFDYTGAYRYSLPENLTNFNNYPSYAAWVRRATAADPADRFASVADWAEQGWGVLREMVAIDSGESKPWTSGIFDNDISGGSDQADFHLLPGLKVDEDDTARGAIDAILKSTTSPAETRMLLEKAVVDFPKSREAKLRLANQLIDTGELSEASSQLQTLAEYDPDDWRNAWYIGKLALAQKDFSKAAQLFDSVVTMLPGEPAAKLALGLAAELSGDLVKAITAYDLVTLVEPQYATAAFGHARCLMKENNRVGALKALKRVPGGHIAHVPAEMECARVCFDTSAGIPSLEDLQQAESIIGNLKVTGLTVQRLRSDLLLAAIKVVESGALKGSKTKLLGVPLEVKALGKASCHELLQGRHECPDAQSVEALVREAHLRRPITTF